jgi:uncharacterized protein (TIGR00290 family)
MAGKILFAWSGGKDSALALHGIRQSGQYEVAALLTTVTEGYDRISMHGVRRALLEAQAESLRLPLEEVLISRNSSNAEYESKMRAALEKYRMQDISAVAFGDIFLEDVRKYREENLAKAGMRGVFPLWKRDTAELAREFVRLGFRAVVTCVDTKALGAEFAGRLLDERFFADLPAGVDPCGENGEYHSFVFGGPIFSREIRFTRGETVLREERFFYCDIIPA